MADQPKQETTQPRGSMDSGSAEKTRSGSGQKFENLNDLKRGSGSSNGAANRQSFTEQTKKEGSLGALWDKVVRG